MASKWDEKCLRDANRHFRSTQEIELAAISDKLQQLAAKLISGHLRQYVANCRNMESGKLPFRSPLRKHGSELLRRRGQQTLAQLVEWLRTEHAITTSVSALSRFLERYSRRPFPYGVQANSLHTAPLGTGGLSKAPVPAQSLSPSLNTLPAAIVIDELEEDEEPLHLKKPSWAK